MSLFYVRSRDPEVLSAYMARLQGLRIAIISGPIFAKDKWYLWVTSEKGAIKNNLDLDG